MALLKVYSVHDKKVERYLQPFFCPHVGDALRAFERDCVNKETILHTHPEDFELHEVATFDEKKGIFEALPKPVVIISAEAAKSQPLTREPLQAVRQ